MSDQAARKPRHVPALDGLRALAIGAVLPFHAQVWGAELGWLGVELFFVLSGFLITSLLLDERARTGRIDLPSFWARRLLRLMPAAWCLLILMTAFAVLGFGEMRTSRGWTPAAYVRSYWLYYCNYAPEGVWRHHYKFFHMWSLAVEEQFYLAWPIVMAACLAWRRPAAEIVAWAGAAAVLVHNYVAPHPFPRQLDNRGYALLFGCGAAFRTAASPKLAARLAGRGVVEVAGLAACAMAIVATVLHHRGRIDETYAMNNLAPWFSVAFAVACAGLWHGSSGPAARLLTLGPLMRVGRVSYGIYLFHMIPCVVFMQQGARLARGLGWLATPTCFAAYLAAAYGLAALSHRYVESPFLRLKSRLRQPAAAGRAGPWPAS